MQRSTSIRYFTILLVLLLAGASCWLVWPTRYRYDRWQSGGSDIPVRINRFTGQAEMLTGDGWYPMQGYRSASSATTASVELPPPELARLQGRCSIDYIQWINCDIYNGSSWTVREITVAITVSGGPVSDSKKVDRPDFIPEVLSRDYKLTREPYGSGAPLETTKFHAALGFSVAAQQSWTWNIVRAQGSR